MATPSSSTPSASTTQTPLLYSCIAYNTTILTEHSASPSSATSTLGSVVLPKIKHDHSSKLSFSHQSNLIHYISLSSEDYPSSSASNLTFLVVGKSVVGQRVPFGYLVEVKKRFLSQYDPNRTDFAALPPYGCAAFNANLKSMMVQYGATAEGRDDAVGKAQREIEDVREIMVENIERVLERGERINLLVDKTDKLGGSARDFRVRSRGLRRRMFWKNIKLMVLLACVVVFLLYLFVGFGCGLPAWQRCTRRN
jgi:vesicle-associated membrane protein 7